MATGCPSFTLLLPPSSLVWIWQLRFARVAFRGLSIVCGGLSLLFVWSEATLAQSKLSPFAAILDSAGRGGIEVCADIIATFFVFYCVCVKKQCSCFLASSFASPSY